MERFTPLYAVAYAILEGMEDLRFDKEGYFYVLVFYGLFYKRNRKHFFPCSHTLYKHSWEFGRIRHSVETLELRARVPASSSNFYSFLYNCMKTRKMFFLS